MSSFAEDPNQKISSPNDDLQHEKEGEEVEEEKGSGCLV